MPTKEVKLTRAQLRRLNEELKKAKVKTEITEACDHPILEQLVEKNSWYQCKNPKCRTVFFLHNMPGWLPSGFINMMSGLAKNIKEKNDRGNNSK